ncbi:hypothetical protein QBC42DRAFT_257453 [Cladorrhinum samala]|uniref:CID domain-containing protein n=1 Tax=Cladorrhinum samala TaxID=585594 RepID=A0AAV9I1P5_9PEZI|nr:hypothetical protein QBC42DRAFT_257453 [Cladorrhinum samala]
MASASAELTVTKAALTAALFRADPKSCSRSDIESMLDLLNSTVTECSPLNVQRCKQWALSNLVPSSARVAPFCKYLVALAKSFGSEKDAPVQNRKGRVPSAKRRRLHLLYVLNDILYHAKFRDNAAGFAQKLEPALPALVRSAVSFKNCPKHIRKVQDLVRLWEENHYFGQAFIRELLGAIEAPSPEGEDPKDAKADTSADAVARAARNEPFTLPGMHGDPSTPWYDLPAANWLSVMEPNSTRPMNTSMIKPLVLAKGPAEKNLVDAVKKLLADVDKIYLKETNSEDASRDIGQMGETIELDEFTGEIIDGETYYGWSRAFCNKMKARKKNGGRLNSGEARRGRSRSARSYSRSRSTSRSHRRRHRSEDSSRSSSRPAFKRQRFTRSPRNNSRSGSRSRSRSRSRSQNSGENRDRSHSQESRNTRDSRRRRYKGGSRGRSPSASRSRSRNGSRGSRYEPRSPSYSRSPSRSRSRSQSASRPGRRYDDLQQPRNDHTFAPGGGHFPQDSPPLPPPPSMGYSHGQMPNFPGGFPPVPPPPPPPQNYGGQWVVPPPPPHPFFPHGGPGIVPPPPQFTGNWVPPPPPVNSQHSYQTQPPPPPPGQYQNNHYYNQDRGGGGGYRGRGGGYGRGGNKWN